MAKYAITHSCGHQVTHQIAGPTKDRDGRVRWLAERPCQECQRAAEAAEAADRNQAAGLPALAGTAKQVTWAEQIRADFEVFAGKLGAYAKTDQERQTFAAWVAWVRGQTTAAWWIDHRDRGPQGLLVLARDTIAKEAN